MKVKKTERKFTKVSSMREQLRVLARHGDKVVYRFYLDALAKDIGEMTYRELTDLTHDIAAGFHSRGMQDSRVAILGETAPRWVATYMATIASGNVAVPLDRELNMDDMMALLAFGEVDTLVYSPSYAAKVAPYIGSHETVRTFICMESDPETETQGALSLDSVAEQGRALADYTYPERDPEAMAEMLFTSGTTGSSKCVMLSEKNVISAVCAACNTVEFFPEDTIVSVLPIHHTYELCCMLAGMNYGMTVGINDSLKHVLKSFATFRPTGLVLVPLFVETMYKRIWETAEKTGKAGKLRFGLKLSACLRFFGIDLRKKLFKQVLDAFGGRLTRIVCGGAPLNPATVKRFEGMGITIMEGYGITECSPLISVNPYYALKSGSVGPAVDCCRVKLIDTVTTEEGRVEGEICAKGDNVMIGYYKNDEENARAFTEDGWYRTGDVGYMDKDGYIYITGRKKSVIVLENGKNVFPEEIEEYLGRIDGLLESVVVGRTGEDGVVTLTAIVVPDPARYENTDDEQVMSEIKPQIMQMNKRLASFKHVKAIEIRRDPFEKTTSRKIKRHLVK